MRKYVCMLLLWLVPGLAMAQTSDWAFPTLDATLPQALQDAVTKDDDAARAQVAGALVSPAVPKIVLTGKGDNVARCGGCHLGSGLGQPQSAPLAGLPAAYFMQQMADFASGARTGYRQQNMSAYAKGMTEAETKEVADYYATLKHPAWINVIEADVAPKSYVGRREIRGRFPEGGTEVLGIRIVELAKSPQSPYQAGTAYEAYVPRGSLAKGEALVTMGGGKTIACGGCHGANLQGNGAVPPLAGRSPVHTARQLYQYQTGNRAGPTAATMKDVVARLQSDDVIAISAYLASRPPM